MTRNLVFLLLVSWVLLRAATARADTHAAAPGLDVTVDVGSGRVLVAGQGATSIALERSQLAAGVDARAEIVGIAKGRRVAHVVVHPSGQSVAWEALFAAGQRSPLFAGLTGFSRGDEGERTGETLRFIPSGDGTTFVLKGEIREDLELCGERHGTPLRASVLDPATLSWHAASFQPVTADQRAGATAVTATPLGHPADPALARLLAASGSSAPGDDGTELTDGDPRTVWSERRGSIGAGEFVLMNASSDVPIAHVALTIAPPSPSPTGASPKTLFLVADSKTWAVTIPEDAWLHPGVAYDVPLGAPVKTTCLSLVLDDAWLRDDPRPEVSVAEVTAYSDLDGQGATLDKVAAALADTARASEAEAILRRAGDDGMEAVARAFDALSVDGQAMAIQIAVGHPSCAAGTPLLLRAMSAKDTELAGRARAKLESCGSKSAAALAAALATGDGTLLSHAAPLLAALGPGVALGPLAGALAVGPPPARRAVREALASVAKGADRESLRALVADGSRGAEARVDLLRALGPRLPEMESEARAAITALLAPPATMPQRYLLMAPLGALARASDAWAAGELASHAKTDADWQVRAHAAAEGRGVTSLADTLVTASADASPRVREAAMTAMAVPAPSASFLTAAKKRLVEDHWTFVRVAAVSALAADGPSADVDATLGAALKDAAPLVRGAAAAAIGQRRVVRFEDALVERIADGDEDTDVRITATAALGDMCDARMLDTLTSLVRAASLPMADEAEARIGVAAIDALGKIHPADLASRLSLALDPNAPPAPRALARRALEQPGGCGRSE